MYSSPPRYTSPPSYSQVRYTATPVTPATAHSASRFTYTAVPRDSSSKAHRRNASYDPAVNNKYTPPPPSYYASSPNYPSTGYYTFTPLKQPDFGVSAKQHVLNKARRAADKDGSKQRKAKGTKYTTYTAKPQEYYSRPPHAGRDLVDEDEGYYSPGKGSSPPPPYQDYDYNVCECQCTDCNPFPQVAAGHKRSADSPKNKVSSRPRAQSSTTYHQPSSRPRANSKVKSPAKATPADAARAHIPAGYSYKNWDPTEEPILLLGSVFDANSLGKWIYDWTVYTHGAATPMSDLAGDLWLLLIQLAGKIKRAEECMPRIRHPEDQDLVEEFLDSGERLWQRFGKILKACEDYMWRAASKEAKKRGTNVSASMGAKSGCEFVDSIFGRDRKLEETEKLMTGMRLWSMRFDANCEDILRHPSA